MIADCRRVAKCVTTAALLTGMSRDVLSYMLALSVSVLLQQTGSLA